MAGYHGFSKSNNALDAEADGKLTATATVAWLRGKGIRITIALLRAHVWPAEWHHTSKMYNRTDYFDTERALEFFTSPEGLAAIEAARLRPKETAAVTPGCRVEWLEWSGSRAHPKVSNRIEFDCTVAVKGASATVTMADGGKIVKRLKTAGFSYTDRIDSSERDAWLAKREQQKTDQAALYARLAADAAATRPRKMRQEIIAGCIHRGLHSQFPFSTPKAIIGSPEMQEFVAWLVRVYPEAASLDDCAPIYQALHQRWVNDLEKNKK